MTRVAVMGAGANGASIGADLTAAGLDVTLVEQWPEHVEAMRSRGLRVVLPEGATTHRVEVVHLCEVATLRRPFDVVLLLVKAYDTRWAAELMKPLLAPDGLMVGVQNGMTLDDVADVVGEHRTLGCVIEISSMMFDARRRRAALGPRPVVVRGGQHVRGDGGTRRGRRLAPAPLGIGRGGRRRPGREVDEAGEQRDDAGDDGGRRSADARGRRRPRRCAS